MRLGLAFIAAAVLLTGCRAQPKPSAPRGVGWREIGTWSGRGNSQTESFASDSGQLRVRWQTSHETAPGKGAFRLTAHSAISGRPLQVAVDRQGVGQGTGYVDQDPHVFYLVIESANLDWSFTLDEAAGGTVEGPGTFPRQP